MIAVVWLGYIKLSGQSGTSALAQRWSYLRSGSYIARAVRCFYYYSGLLRRSHGVTGHGEAISHHVCGRHVNIYISRLWYDDSVRLSVRLSVMEVHCGHGACQEEGRGHLALCYPLLGPLVKDGGRLASWICGQ